MSDFLQLVFALVVILLAAKLAGYLTTRAGQPAVFGELLVGALLGPSLINLVHLPFNTNPNLGDTISALGGLGVLLLMFLAGLDLHLKELAHSSAASAYAGTLGVFFPVCFGILIGLCFHLPLSHAVFLGLTIAASSVSISAQTLFELKALRSRVGLGLLGAAVLDDILVILLLSIFLAISSGASGALDVLVIILRMAVFLALSAGFGLWVLPRLVDAVHRLSISQGVLTLAIVILLVYALAAELFGAIAAITGSFIAGLMFARTPQKASIESGLNALAYGFFVPIFFVNIGLSVDLTVVTPAALFLLVTISLAAILGKIIGAGLGARLAKYSWVESLQLGVGMIARIEVSLILANLGLSKGYLNQDIFSAIVGMILITTFVTPPLLRLAFSLRSAPLKEIDPAP
jgi:Kef-type K+ transport system membrane component KefB